MTVSSTPTQHIHVGYIKAQVLRLRGQLMPSPRPWICRDKWTTLIASLNPQPRATPTPLTAWVVCARSCVEGHCQRPCLPLCDIWVLVISGLQGYLVHKKPPTPLGPP